MCVPGSENEIRDFFNEFAKPSPEKKGGFLLALLLVAAFRQIKSDSDSFIRAKFAILRYNELFPK